MKKIAIVVAMAENRVIGRNNELPWHIPEDLKYFKKITTGHPILMGRKTFESIGRPLPNRINIVITANSQWSAKGVIVCHDIEEAMRVAARQAAVMDVEYCMVIGGARLYRQILDRADRLYLTLIHAKFEGDTTFPAVVKSDWIEVSRIENLTETGNTPGYSFIVLDRKNAGG